MAPRKSSHSVRNLWKSSHTDKLVPLLQVVAIAANKATDPDELLKFCLDEVCIHSGWPVAHAYLVAEGTPDCLVPSRIWHLEDGDRYTLLRKRTEETIFSPGAGLPGRVLATKAAMWVVDVTRVNCFLRARGSEDLGIRTAIGVPILVGATVVGVLEFFAPEPVPRDVALLDVMGHIGTQLGEVYRRHRAEKALRLSEKRNRLILESAYDAFVAIDDEGTITDWNPQAEVTFGWTREEALGQRLRDTIVPEKFRTAHEKGLAHFLATGEGPALNRRFEISALHRDGHEFPVELTISSVQIDDKFVFSAFIHDISERKRAQEELQNAHDTLEHTVRERTAQLELANSELARSNAELEQFASIASHDLKEPLRMISTYTQLLGSRYKGKLDANADNYIRYVADGARRMGELIESVLAFSRVGQRGKAFRPIDCAPIVARVLEVLHAAAKEGSVDISVDSLPVVLGDEVQLAQLFQNLVGNAVKFRRNDGPRVRISAKQCDAGWTFSIEDNGIGIDDGDCERVFRLFERLNSRHEYPGAGIGLAVCKKIVERHGGRIWVESRLGEGTAFHFTLPAAAGATLH